MTQKHRLLITIPPEVRKWLQTNAKFNGGSQSGEVVRALREKMARIKSKPRTLSRAETK
jgi:hypothetical protein